MMNETVAIKIKNLFADEEFAKKFSAAEDFAEVKQLFADNGIDISDDELNHLLEAMLAKIEARDGSELSEDQLENVAGGFIEWIILGGVFAVVGGVSAYKLRKVINSATGKCHK